MKCPFRIVEKYEKLQKYTTPRQEGGYRHYAENRPCSKQEADTVTQEFADCLYLECPYFYGANQCRRIANE